MNTHLNNFLDKCEGKPENTSNNNILKEMARQMGMKGGKRSVETRLGGKTKEERSKIMSLVRMSKLSKKENKQFEANLDESIKLMNKKIILEK